MAGTGALVDLSLFATSPSDGRQFAASYMSPTDHGLRDVSCYTAQRRFNVSQERNYMMKSLPPLPRRRLCRRRPPPRRGDPTSPCILDRLKRTKMHCPCCEQRPTLQQRRHHTTAPTLTLSLPAASHEGRGTRRERAPRATMIWMPDEQMWLVQDPTHLNAGSHVRSYVPPPRYSGYRYTRSEPSPEPSALFDLPPLSPARDQSVEHEEPADEIRNQFLRLMQPEEDERLSSLFQEAIQAVPPMTDTAPSTPHATYAIDDDWTHPVSGDGEEDASIDTSTYDSYHTAVASPDEDNQSIRSPVSPETLLRYPNEESRSIYTQISRDNPWGHPGDHDFTNHPLGGGPVSVISSQLTHEDSWIEGVHRGRFSPLSYNDSPWSAMGWALTRPRSANN